MSTLRTSFAGVLLTVTWTVSATPSSVATIRAMPVPRPVTTRVAVCTCAIAGSSETTVAWSFVTGLFSRSNAATLSVIVPPTAAIEKPSAR